MEGKYTVIHPAYLNDFLGVSKKVNPTDPFSEITGNYVVLKKKLKLRISIFTILIR